MTSPKTFISYAWTSDSHIQWVLRLASELRHAGVDVVLDKWDLKEGHDANAFMERMVADPTVTKVIMVCDASYVEKANRRSGGVGAEAQIISPSLFEKVEQDKFVAAVLSKSEEGRALVPVFYGSRIHIDFSDEEKFSESFDQLLRWVYGKPLYIRPPLGKRPSHLDQPDGAQIGSGTRHRAALDALRRGAQNGPMLVEDYLNSVTADLSMQVLDRWENEQRFDEFFDRCLAGFLPAKNSIIELVTLFAVAQETEGLQRTLHRFLERMAALQFAPKSLTSYHSSQFDHFKFMCREVFLAVVTILVSRERFEWAAQLLQNKYYVAGMVSDHRPMQSFMVFNESVDSLEERKLRKGLTRASMVADLLNERRNGSGLSLDHMIQADFIVFLRSVVEVRKKGSVSAYWAPETLFLLGYHRAALEVFARSESKAYFERLRPLLGVSSVAELVDLTSDFRGSWYGSLRINVAALANLDQLATAD